MIGMIKFFIVFIISFTVLSIPMNNRALFYHVSKVTSPVMDTLFDSVEKVSGDVYESGKKVGRKLFSNADPIIDSVRSTSSSQSKKRRIKKAPKNAHRESYSNEEIKALESIIESDL